MNIDKPKDFVLYSPESMVRNVFNQLCQVITPKYPNSVFFKLDNEVYMEYDKRCCILWYDADKLISVLKPKVNISYYQTRLLLNKLMEEQKNLESVTYRCRSSLSQYIKWKSIR